MKFPLPRFLTRTLKRILPASLYGRALLILVAPVVLVQILSIYIFYERHWDVVTRHMSSSLAGEISYVVQNLAAGSAQDTQGVINDAALLMGLDVSVSHNEQYVTDNWRGNDDFQGFRRELERRVIHPFRIVSSPDGQEVRVQVKLPEAMVDFRFSIKRLASSTTTIFILWMMGFAVVLLLVAILFLRNQIRPITQLAEAAEAFGKGQEVPGFRPQGASEVRKASKAFIIMRERIKRQIRTRTEMLAGISHDLRTPLTRMKLQLAMQKEKTAQDLNEDVQEMEHMIQEYLDFARGEGGEEPALVNLREWLGRVRENYKRRGQDIVLTIRDDAELQARPMALSRCISNIIDNAFYYGASCALTAKADGEYVTLIVDDQGPGIPADKRKEVFRPFTRLDPSRNLQTGGAGLGLAIARDIVLSHGGEILLEDAPGGGLRVAIKLPI